MSVLADDTVIFRRLIAGDATLVWRHHDRFTVGVVHTCLAYDPVITTHVPYCLGIYRIRRNKRPAPKSALEQCLSGYDALCQFIY